MKANGATEVITQVILPPRALRGMANLMRGGSTKRKSLRRVGLLFYGWGLRSGAGLMDPLILDILTLGCLVFTDAGESKGGEFTPRTVAEGRLGQRPEAQGDKDREA